MLTKLDELTNSVNELKDFRADSRADIKHLEKQIEALTKAMQSQNKNSSDQTQTSQNTSPAVNKTAMTELANEEGKAPTDSKTKA